MSIRVDKQFKFEQHLRSMPLHYAARHELYFTTYILESTFQNPFLFRVYSQYANKLIFPVPPNSNPFHQVDE